MRPDADEPAQRVGGLGSHLEVVVDDRGLPVEQEARVRQVGLEQRQQRVEQLHEPHAERLERRVPLAVPVRVRDDRDGDRLRVGHADNVSRARKPSRQKRAQCSGRKPFTQREPFRNLTLLRSSQPGQRRPGALGGVLILEGALKKFLRRGSLVASLAVMMVALFASAAFAQEGPTLDDVTGAAAHAGRHHAEPVVGRDRRRSSSCSCRPGFALVETGFCRKKHAAHVMSTNFAIFGLGFVGVLPHRVPARVRWLQLRAVRAGGSRSVTR